MKAKWITLTVCLLLLTATVRADEAAVADAAERNDAVAMARLLERKANVNAAQPDGMTALHWATYHDETAMVKQLVASGADVSAVNRYGVMPLSLACTNGNAAIVECLLEAGADANSTIAGGETVLMTASRTGRPGPVKALLVRNANVNATERKGQTAVMWAAADGHADVVEMLIEAGADYQRPLASGFTPFFFAVREGRSSVVFRLLERGIQVNDPLQPHGKNGEPTGKRTNALLLALENGHFELAANLLKAKADPNDRPSGYAPLHAISWVRKPIRGDGDPPPIGSGKLNSLELVRQLVAHGADVNLALEKGESGRGRLTTTGSTPFLLASRTGDLALMRLLLEWKADPRRTNVDNSPPLLAAAGVGALGDGDETAGTEEDAMEAIKLLLDLGADINAIDQNDETALHGAAYQSFPQVVKLLADRGANMNLGNHKNKWNWTPLKIAQGHRPGNFRPDPETMAAIERAMQSAGVSLPSR